MEKIKTGKYVELGYDLYRVEADGTETLVHQTDEDDPERFVFGVTSGMIEPLEKAVEGLSKGDGFDVRATAEEAFGQYDPEQVAELDRDLFLVDGKFDETVIKPGAVLPMMTADGYRISGLVKEVGKSHVKLDFNHPLAGSDVRFKGHILEVRDATAEELNPKGGCCGGCGGEGDCGEGCESGTCGCGGCH